MAILKLEAGTLQKKRAVRGWQPGKQHVAPEWYSKQHPVDRRTSRQTTERQRFAAIAFFWPVVDAAGRVAWSNAVSAYAAKQPPGGKTPQNGFTLFMYVNLLLATTGNPMVFTPPSPVDFPTLQINNFTFQSDTKATIALSASGTLTNWLLSVSVQPQATPGNMQPRGQWTRVYLATLLTNNEVVLQGNIGFPYGPVKSGNKLFAMVTVINKVTGQQSQPIFTQTLNIVSYPYQLRGTVATLNWSPYNNRYNLQVAATQQPNINPPAARLVADVQVTTSPSDPANRSSATHAWQWQWLTAFNSIDFGYNYEPNIPGQPAFAPGNKVYIWVYLWEAGSDTQVSNDAFFQFTIPPKS